MAEFLPQLAVTQIVKNSDNCFSRHQKLVSPAQFRLVFQQNDKLSDRYWTLLFRRNQEGHARLGMAVAKKRAKRAVDRNRLKRAIRESFRNSNDLPDVDIVILPRDASVTASNEQLAESLQQQWARMARICAR